MTTAINYTGSSGMSPELRTFYDRNLLERLLPLLVYMFFGQVRPMPARAGQTVQYRRWNSLAAATTPLTEGVTPGNEQPTISTVTANPTQYGSWAEISDLLDFTAPDPVLVETGQLLAEQTALSLDTLVRDVIGAGTTVQYVGQTSRGAITTGNLLSLAEIRKAVRTMQNNKVAKVTNILNPSTGIGTVPVGASYIGIIGPYALYDLKAATGWVPVEQYGTPTPLLPNEVGKLDDVRFILTNNPKIFSAAGVSSQDIHATLILGADSFGVISPMGIENIIKGFGAGDDPLNQRASTGWKVFFTSVILQQLAILRIESSVSA